MGITRLIWLLAGLTVVSAVSAAFATWIAYRTLADLSGDVGRGTGEDDTGRELARGGFWGGTMFLLVILAQCIPILYFLTGC